MQKIRQNAQPASLWQIPIRIVLKGTPSLKKIYVLKFADN